MSDVWVTVAAAAAVLLALGLTLLVRRSNRVAVGDRQAPDAPLSPEEEREQRLARRLARAVGCTMDQALPAVRRELDFAPGQTDETLLKRAAYHYRQDLPEAPCPVYRDRTRG